MVYAQSGKSSVTRLEDRLKPRFPVRNKISGTKPSGHFDPSMKYCPFSETPLPYNLSAAVCNAYRADPGKTQCERRVKRVWKELEAFIVCNKHIGQTAYI